MSSYLTFYGVPKRKSQEEPEQHITLTSYSRSNDIYQLFNDNLNVAYAGDNDVYTELDKDSLDIVYADINNDISKATERLELYEKYANTNVDYINEIISIKDYINDLNKTREKLSFLYDIIIDTENGFSGFEKIVCDVG